MGGYSPVIFLAICVIVLTAIFVVVGMQNSKYQKAQKENNTDKRDMLDLMSRVMQEAYSNYTYLVGYYTKTQQHLNSTTFYYFPYILAFTQDELIVFPFIKKEGKLYVRNRLDVDWSQTEFKYKIGKKGTTLTLKIVGEKMPINLNPVIKGCGVEKSDKPLCVFQEQEYDLFLKYLPGYQSRAK